MTARWTGRRSGVDSLAVRWGAFLRAWRRIYGQHPVTARELCDGATGLVAYRWAGTFPTTSHGRLPSPKSLGRVLTARLGTRVDRLALYRVRDPHTKVHVYWLGPHNQPQPINQLAGHPHRPRTATARDRAPGTDTERSGTAPARQPQSAKKLKMPVGPGPSNTHARIGLRLPVRQQT